MTTASIAIASRNRCRARSKLPSANGSRVTLEDGTRVRPGFDPRQVGEERLSSVQYLEFGVGGRTPVALGSDHPQLEGETALDAEQRTALAAEVASDRGR